MHSCDIWHSSFSHLVGIGLLHHCCCTPENFLACPHCEKSMPAFQIWKQKPNIPCCFDKNPSFFFLPEVTCSALRNVVHGQIQITHGTAVNGKYSCGSIVRYHCDDGFIIQGNKTRECLETGAWESGLTSCLAGNPSSMSKSFFCSFKICAVSTWVSSFCLQWLALPQIALRMVIMNKQMEPTSMVSFHMVVWWNTIVTMDTF